MIKLIQEISDGEISIERKKRQKPNQRRFY